MRTALQMRSLGVLRSADRVRNQIRARRRWWRDPYLLVAALVVLWTVLVTARHAWAGDFRLHLATVHALAADLWIPTDPLVGALSGSPYYSPYAVLLGVIAAVTGADPRTVLEGAAIGNVILLLIALRRFCRNLANGTANGGTANGGTAKGAANGSAVATLALLFTLLLWGLHPREWSGFLGLASLSWTMSYPSVVATALMLFIWDVFVRHRARPQRWRTLATMVVLGTLIVLIHPFTAVNTVIGLVAFAAVEVRALCCARAARLAAAAITIAVLALLWPWSDVLSLFGAAENFDHVHKVLVTDAVKEFGFAHYGLALVALPALAVGGRRPLGRELQVLFLLATAAVVIGAVTGVYGAARVIPVAMLALHLALASYLGRRQAGWTAARMAYTGIVIVVCCVGLYGESAGLARAYWKPLSPAALQEWKARDVTTGYDPLMTALGPRDVVITDQKWLGRLVNARGARTVVPAWPYPFVDEAARRRDTAIFFTATTSPRQRLAIADRYRVTCILAAHRRTRLESGAFPGFSAKARTRGGGYVLLCRR